MEINRIGGQTLKRLLEVSVLKHTQKTPLSVCRQVHPKHFFECLSSSIFKRLLEVSVIKYTQDTPFSVCPQAHLSRDETQDDTQETTRKTTRKRRDDTQETTRLRVVLRLVFVCRRHSSKDRHSKHSCVFWVSCHSLQTHRRHSTLTDTLLSVFECEKPLNTLYSAKETCNLKELVCESSHSLQTHRRHSALLCEKTPNTLYSANTQNTPSRLGRMSCLELLGRQAHFLANSTSRVSPIELYVSFAKEPYKRDDILQKRPLILPILLTVATP